MPEMQRRAMGLSRHDGGACSISEVGDGWKMKILLDVWSDYVCPFCYLEEPVVRQLREEYADDLTVRWRAFELRPEPVPTLQPDGEYLNDIWGRAVYPMATERGMHLRLPPVQPRSRWAHEAAAFAGAQGCFDVMNEALFKAFFSEGRDIGQLDVLVELGRECGLEEAALRQALQEGTHREAVLADETAARELRLSGVPAFLIRLEGEPLNKALEVTGAQPFPRLHAAIERLRVARS